MKLLFSSLFIFITLQGCFFSKKEDILASTINIKSQKEDLATLKEIIKNVHAGAYVYNSPQQIDVLFDSIANITNESSTVREFYNKIDFIADQLKCIHTNTFFPDEYYDSLKNRKLFFDLPVIAINKKMYVNSQAYNLPLGAEVVSINFTSAGSIIEKLQRYYHSDGNSIKIKNFAIADDFAINYYLAYGGAENFLVEYKNPGSDTLKNLNFSAEKLSAIYDNSYDDTYFFYPTDAAYDFEILDNSHTAIITIRTFSFSTSATKTAYRNFLKNSFSLIKKSNIQHLIIDCRNNGGGTYSNTFPFLTYLVNTALPEYDSAIKRYDKLPYPAFVSVQDTSKIIDEDTSGNRYTEIRRGIFSENKDHINVWQPNKNLYKGKLYVIINGRVISAAATFAAILKDRTNAITVGEETGGGNGAHNAGMITYILPNSKIKVAVPTKRFYQPVKDIHPGRGVLPDKEIPVIPDDVINNIDGPLTYILDSIIIN